MTDETKKPKFSPGPWWVLHEGSSEISVQSDEKFICCLNFDPLPKEETEKHLANAALIAAAPEMYEELEKFVELCYKCDCEGYARGAEEILRKVRGESEVNQ